MKNVNREDSERLVRIEEMMKVLVKADNDKEARIRKLEEKTSSARGGFLLVWPIVLAFVSYYIKKP